jgi:DNA polymerase-3 subunit delta
MAARSYEDVLRDLRNKIYAPVYLLTGDEPYFIDQISDFIEANVLDEMEKEFNQTIVYGRDCEPLQLLSIAKRYPMMANYQVVVVREAQEMKALSGKEKEEDVKSKDKEDKNPLTDYFNNPLTSTVLVLCMKYKSPDKRTKMYKAIDKHGVIVTSKKLYDDKLPGWIDSYLDKKKKKINPDAAKLMADHLGNDLSRIANECDKLLFNVKEGQTITAQDVATNIGISKEFNIFELQDAISERDILKTNRIVNYFRANPKANPFVLTIATLNAFFTKVLLFHSSPDKSDSGLIAALKINPYFIKSYKTAARNYPFEKTAAVIGLLREFDLKSKGVDNSASEGDLLRELTFRILH